MMSDIIFKCPECSKHLVVDGTAKGKILKCTDCGQPIQVPWLTLTFKCPACMWNLSAPEALIGEEFHCPNCNETFVVPTASSETPAPNSAGYCPGCVNPISPTAPVCLICGFDQHTGKPRLSLKNTPDGTGTKTAPQQNFPLARSSSSSWKPNKIILQSDGKNRDDDVPIWFKRAIIGTFLIIIAVAWYQINADEMEEKAKAEKVAKVKQENAEAWRVEQLRWASLTEKQREAERESSQIRDGYKILGDGDVERGKRWAEQAIENENERRSRAANGIIDVHVVP